MFDSLVPLRLGAVCAGLSSVLVAHTPAAPPQSVRSAPSSPDPSRLALEGVVEVRSFLPTLDESRIVWSGVNGNGTLELYSTKAEGGSSVRLSDPLPADRVGVTVFQPTPGSRHVVYLADHEKAGRLELYAVATSGGPVVKIDRPVLNRSIADRRFWVPDDQHVFFLDGTGTKRLYSAPLTGGPFVPISQTSGAVAVDSIRFSADGERIAYFGHFDFGVFGLFSARADGRGPPSPLAFGSLSLDPPVEIADGAARVVFGGGSSLAFPSLYSVPIKGQNPPRRISGSLGGRELAWQVTPEGRQVVYQAWRVDAPGTLDLFAVPADGSAAPVRVSDNAPDQSILTQVTGSGDVAFVSGPTGGDRFELLGASLGGGVTPSALSRPGDNLLLDLPGSPLPWGPLVRVDLDGAHVLFLASDALGRISLQRAPFDGRRPATALAALTPGDWIPAPLLPARPQLEQDPLSRRVVYVSSSTDPARPSTLISVPADGSAAAVQLSGPFPTGALGVRRFVLGPRSGRVYYTADPLTPGVVELFRVPSDGSERPTRLVGL